MIDPQRPEAPRTAQPAVTDLPPQDGAKDEAVKGGAVRRGGDEDLEDLEVER